MVEAWGETFLPQYLLLRSWFSWIICSRNYFKAHFSFSINYSCIRLVWQGCSLMHLKMTRSKKTQRETAGNSDPSSPTCTANQSSLIIIDVLDEVSSGTLYPAGFLLFLCFICHLIIFLTLLYREETGSERFSNLLKGTQTTWWQAWDVNSGLRAIELVFHYIHCLPNLAKLCHIYLC